MRLLVTDLPAEAARYLTGGMEGWRYASPDTVKIHQCIGCMECWRRNGNSCVINDGFSKLIQGEGIEEIWIVSRPCFGSPSPYAKSAVDRLFPLYPIQIDARLRGEGFVPAAKLGLKLSLSYYGGCGDSEKEIARLYAARLGRQWNAEQVDVAFFEAAESVTYGSVEEAVPESFEEESPADADGFFDAGGEAEAASSTEGFPDGSGVAFAGAEGDAALTDDGEAETGTPSEDGAEGFLYEPDAAFAGAGADAEPADGGEAPSVAEAADPAGQELLTGGGDEGSADQRKP